MMRIFFILILLTVGTVGVNAAGHLKALPADIRNATCDDILAHENDNKQTKMLAASLYAHGQFMGKSCLKPDYVRAFKLFDELGAKDQIRAHLKILKTRAESGNPSAINHLKKLKKAGYK